MTSDWQTATQKDTRRSSTPFMLSSLSLLQAFLSECRHSVYSEITLSVFTAGNDESWQTVVKTLRYFWFGVRRFAGYDTGACRQPPPVVYTLKLLIGAAPVACITTGLMILVVYPISEDVRLRNKLALEKLRWRKPSASVHSVHQLWQQ